MYAKTNEYATFKTELFVAQCDGAIFSPFSLVAQLQRNQRGEIECKTHSIQHMDEICGTN